MPSSKQFVEEEALEKAMNAFWRRGYEGIGLAELLTEMGISRQSLYDTFGNKRRLFVLCIEHYQSTQLSRALALLDREGSQLDNVRALMHFFADLALDEQCRGCLVANALVEVAPHDEEISELLRETLGLLQSALERALTAAQERGELAATRSPRALSQALLNAMIGMTVTGKLRLSSEAVREAHSGTLNLLD